MENSNTNKHNYALDVLRIITCFLVVLLHVCGYGIADTSLAIPKTIFSINDYQIYNFCCCLSRSAVIIFVMISGSFLLDPSIELTNARLKKHILKIVKLFFFFSLMGVLCDMVFKSYFNDYRFNILEVINNLIVGEGHLWYLYMILCLYILTPILRRISSDRFALNEFIIIGLFISVIVESISILFPCEMLLGLFGKLHLNLVTGYTVYYLLGYKLKLICEENQKINNKNSIFTLILVFLTSVFITYFLTANAKIVNNDLKDSPYYSYFFITNVLEAISLFYIALIINEKYDFRNKLFIKKLSSFTAGIYCVHYYVISYLLKFSDFNFATPLRIMILMLLTIVISVIITYILKKIPIIKDIV